MKTGIYHRSDTAKPTLLSATINFIDMTDGYRLPVIGFTYACERIRANEPFFYSSLNVVGAARVKRLPLVNAKAA